MREKRIQLFAKESHREKRLIYYIARQTIFSRSESLGFLRYFRRATPVPFFRAGLFAFVYLVGSAIAQATVRIFVIVNEDVYEPQLAERVQR